MRRGPSPPPAPSPLVPPRRLAAPGRARALAIVVALGALATPAGSAAFTSVAPADSDSAYARPVPTPPATRAAEWETLETGLPEEVRLRPIVGLRMNRVDGLALRLGGAFRTARGPAPLLFASVTGATARKRPVLFEAGVEEPIGDRPWLRIGGSVYRSTENDDEWIVAELENTLFALFARTDYRDHYEAEGAQGYVAWSPGSDFSARLAIRFERQRSLPTEAEFAFFGKEDEFRPNPAIAEGDEEAWTATIGVGPETLGDGGGTQGELSYERTGEPLHGDFDYGRFRGLVREKWMISRLQEARFRLIAGTTQSGTLSPQKVWHLGGIGTLRGHEYKVYSGDQFFLATAEHYVKARKNVYPFWFLDYGSAWFGKGNLDRQRPALDGGLGIRLGKGWVVATVAKNLRDTGTPLLVGVRFLGPF